MAHASSASFRILFLESKQEESNKNQDSVWRSWLSFCSLSGVNHDPFLLTLPKLGCKFLIFVPSSISTAMLNGARQMPSQASVATQWLQTLCAMLQYFGTIYNQTPCTSKVVLSCTPPSKSSYIHELLPHNFWQQWQQPQQDHLWF
jgi:hypothetical protein